MLKNRSNVWGRWQLERWGQKGQGPPHSGVLKCARGPSYLLPRTILRLPSPLCILHILKQPLTFATGYLYLWSELSSVVFSEFRHHLTLIQRSLPAMPPSDSKHQFLGTEHDCYYATDPRVNKELATSLAGKICVIAGAGRGIGQAIARFFAHASAKVLVLYALEQDELDATARQCKEIHPDIKINTAVLDVRDADAVKTALESVDTEFGGIDVLLMNAGRPPQWLDTVDSNPKIWWDTVAISLQGAFNFSRYALPIMQRQKSGRIIFTSSSGAHLNFGFGSYTLSKLALIRMAEIIHAENYKQFGIHAFAFHPGAVQTRFYYDFEDKALGKPARINSYVEEGAENEDKSAELAFNTFKGIQWDTPEMAAGLVLALSAGKLDFMSGRYVDASVNIEKYIADKDSIVEQDLHRVRLHYANSLVDGLMPVLEY